MASQPSLRIGDRERDAVAAELQEHFAHGRLSLEEFNQRLDAVFAAKTQHDLSQITSDLPHVRSGGAPLPSSRAGSMRRLASGPPLGGWPVRGAMATPVLTPVWGDSPGPGRLTHGWQEGPGGDWYGRGSGHGIGFLATVLAALASWLLVYDFILVGMRSPWPRLGLLLAVFAVIRGLIRRIFRGPRGRRPVGRRW